MLSYLLWQTPALWDSASLTQKAANSDIKSHLTYPAAAQMHLGQCYTGVVFIKNFKETVWMLTQMAVAMCPNHPGLPYSPCQGRELAVSTALRATRQLSKAQSCALLPACSTNVVSAEAAKFLHPEMIYLHLKNDVLCI